MKVIDSSTLVKFFSKEKGWEKVTEIISEGVATLDLAIKEIASALWKKVIREEMDESVAIRILSDLLKKEAIITVNQDEYLVEAFKIATKYKITVYDALFIALAKSMKTELITSDKKQYDASLKEGIKSQFI
ncbi:type II toxin-antitoxin system VapC family toxin [Sulfurisphaera ohwakuensis]|uniref:type II toxin-antitoxin system VapC family toxin n=1 Tax=Sulfurisphaera ohwakuensis TaxID=69656 RepID=UPI0036F37730